MQRASKYANRARKMSFHPALTVKLETVNHVAKKTLKPLYLLKEVMGLFITKLNGKIIVQIGTSHVRYQVT